MKPVSDTCIETKLTDFTLTLFVEEAEKQIEFILGTHDEWENFGIVTGAYTLRRLVSVTGETA